MEREGSLTTSFISIGIPNPLTMKIPFWQGGLILGVILLLILATGCTEKTTPESSITPRYPDETEDPLYPITFNEGVTLMNSIFSGDGTGHNESLPLYYVQGRSVNSQGKAEQWIFGTKVSGDQYFVIVESNRGVLVPHEMVFPERSIDVDTIVLPDALISGNMQLMQRTFGGNGSIPLIQIELQDDTYILTPSDNRGNMILYIDAITGRPLNR